MTPAIGDVTQPIPVVPGDRNYPTSVLFMPVFVGGGARRRRMLARGRDLAATACVAYLIMLGVSITASPVSKPGSASRLTPGATGPGVAAPRSPQARPAGPRAGEPVDTGRTRPLADADAAQDALVLRPALSAPTQHAQPPPPTATRSALTAPPTPRQRRDDDHPKSHAPPITANPVALSVAAPATATTPREAR